MNRLFQIDRIDIGDKQTTETQRTIKTATASQCTAHTTQCAHTDKQGFANQTETNKTNKMSLHFSILTILLLFVLWMMDTIHTHTIFAICLVALARRRRRRWHAMCNLVAYSVQLN